MQLLAFTPQEAGKGADLGGMHDPLPPGTVGDMTGSNDNHPEWADRLRRERQARGWTQADVVAALRTFADVPLPEGLLDQWKRWERGRNKPDEFYRPLIAATFGTVVESIFGQTRSLKAPVDTNELLIAKSGMSTLELVQRLRESAIDDSTLDALHVTVEQLCCDYGDRDPAELINEAREWLRSINELLASRVTLAQHRDLLDSASWLTLLVGCLEYDSGHKSAETTRAAAAQLGSESGNASVIGWAHEMTAWFNLTGGHYRSVIAASQAGIDQAPGRSVAVQLYTQEAKAWARMGNQRNVMRALENGRALLESLPYPERPDHHFIIDHEKFDYYAMDCYRIIGDDAMAEAKAREVLRRAAPEGQPLVAPMRAAEATLTLGVVAARSGDFDQAIKHGNYALEIPRKSKPSLRMVGSELDEILRARYPQSSEARDFHDALTRATT